MVQMTAKDQAIVKSMPGNSRCCDCGVANPQWASVPFGNLFCLICSGVHRSLGVHISFVRSVDMDSWSDKQLLLMKGGGNDALNNYLKQHGIDWRTPVKEKYESPAAQLYKEVLKARLEGRPEPTQLPTPAPPKTAPARMIGNGGGGGGGGGGHDAKGMERLIGETDQDYIARQTRLRDEARVRMAAKFGGSSRMGGVGGGGGGGMGSSRMAGIGSDPSYDPNRSYAGRMGGNVDVDAVMSGVGSAFSTMGFLAGAAAQTAAGAAQNVSTKASTFIQDENTQKSISGLTTSVKSTGASFWGGLTSSVGNVAKVIAQPDEEDGLEQLQRQFQNQKPNSSVKYSGFGSDNVTRKASNVPSNLSGMSSMPNSNVGEAPGLPGEDRNGMERLTGETDEQYIARQTRLRNEAKARMAAKFGGGGLGSASSSRTSDIGSSGFGMKPAVKTMGGGMMNSRAPSTGSTLTEAPGLPGEDPSGIERLTGETDEQYVVRQTRLRDEAKARMAAKFGGGGLSSAGPNMTGSAPSSGRLTPPRTSTPSSGSLTPPRGMQLKSGTGSAPSSGNFNTQALRMKSAAKSSAPAKPLASQDFFASFGT